jgi:hemolysin activation/secretion protein
VDTDSDVATIGALNVIGAGRIYGLRYVMPLASSDGYYPGLSAGVDYKDFDENIVLDDGADQAPITYANWSLAYNSTWQREKSTTALNLGANVGLRGVVNDADEFAYKRYNARPNYFYLRGGLRYDRGSLPIPGRLFVRVDGQVTLEPLISNEQFAIGGAESVRGYLEAEQLGDNGLSGTLEWHTPALADGWGGGWMQGSYALVFADAGLVGILDALPEQSSGTELASAGIGLRLAPWKRFDAELDWAYPFLAGERTAEGDSRLHFRVRYDF